MRPLPRVLFPLLLLFLAGTGVRAQSTVELIEQLDAAETDGERYGILYDLTGELLDSKSRADQDLALNFSKQLYQTAGRLGDAKLTGPAAYTLALAYRNKRDDRNTEKFMETAMEAGMKAGDPDLIISAVSELSRLTAKRRNYREANRHTQRALDYFTANGGNNNISKLRAALERERAALAEKRRDIARQSEGLNEEVARLSTERDALEGTNARLEREKRERDRQLASTGEELARRSEELTTVQEEKQRAEARTAEMKRDVSALTREALEQRAITIATREELAQETIHRQELQLDAEHRQYQLYGSLAVGAILLLLAALFYTRFRIKNRAAAELAAANTALDDARRQSDDLLENILPAEIARELKTTGKARARRFPEATVLFCDFVNFTATAERLGAEALVEELDLCFRAFDRIVEEHPGVEKIKTIGDAYMVASGLTQRKELPHDIVRVALKMQEFLAGEAAKRGSLGLPFFTGRIGLHTGPVVAGVVGQKKFAYDIWGDTVNVASRLESASAAGKVNVSESTYDLIRYRFRCDYRGKISVKNKGEIDMYFVEEELA